MFPMPSTLAGVVLILTASHRGIPASRTQIFSVVQQQFAACQGSVWQAHSTVVHNQFPAGSCIPTRSKPGGGGVCDQSYAVWSFQLIHQLKDCWMDVNPVGDQLSRNAWVQQPSSQCPGCTVMERGMALKAWVK